VRSLLEGHAKLVRPPLPKDSILSKAVGHIKHADEDAECTVPLSLIISPVLDSPVMNEEIFGPLLPVLKVADATEAVKFMRARPKPLVCYCYSPDSAVWSLLEENTSSGNLAVNCGPQRMQGNFNVGHGGVGSSGYGRSIWGRAAFDDFSNAKTVFLGRRFAGSTWGAASRKSENAHGPSSAPARPAA